MILLFEAFTEEKYKKVFQHVKQLVLSGTDRDEILKYIDSVESNNIDSLNKIRLIIQRIIREMMNYTYPMIIDRQTIKPVKKRDSGYGYSHGQHISWNAGDIVSLDRDKFLKIIAFDKKYLIGLYSFLERNKEECEKIINEMDQDSIKTIKFLCDRFFEVLEWSIEHGPEKHEIIKGFENWQIKKSKIENINDMDFDNECDELSKVSNLITKQINKLI